jgi:hypothetical protein
MRDCREKCRWLGVVVVRCRRIGSILMNDAFRRPELSLTGALYTIEIFLQPKWPESDFRQEIWGY